MYRYMENKEKSRDLWKETEEMKIKMKELEDRIFEIERTAIFDTPSPEPAPADTIVHAELVSDPNSLENSKKFKVRKMRNKALKSGTKCLFRFPIDRYDDIDHPGRPQLPDIPVTIIDFHEELSLVSHYLELDDPYSYIYEIEFPDSKDLLKEGYTQGEIDKLGTGWNGEMELVYNPRSRDPRSYYHPPKYKTGKNKGKEMKLLKINDKLWNNHFKAGSDGSNVFSNGTLHPYKKASLKKKKKKKKSKKRK